MAMVIITMDTPIWMISKFKKYRLIISEPVCFLFMLVR